MAQPRGETNVGVRDRDLVARRASMMLMHASSGNCQDLAIDIDQGDGEPAALEVLTRETGSPLHVVAAAGDSKQYLDSARTIVGRASHLLAARDGKGGDTPLHCAARAGNTRMVALLVDLAIAKGRDEARALVAAQNLRGETALHEAVRFGDVKMVRALMDGGTGLARVVAEDGTSPMYLACSLGRRDIACELHQKDGELPYSGPDGQNALHAAVLHHRGIAKLLLKWDKGLVNQTDVHGSTPMHFAASALDPSFQFTNFVFTTSNVESHFLGSYHLPRKWLAEFYKRRKLPLPLLLKDHPYLAFQPDMGGSYPVHVAASVDSMVSIIVLLTRYPGCAGLCDGMGRTFLHVAVLKKRFHVVQFACHWARSFKQVLNVQDKDGNTALHLAIMEEELDIFRCLVRNRDVKINLQNGKGKTPMDLALGKVHSGFYFGLTAPRRILGMLNFINAQTANRRRDQLKEYGQRLDDKEESKKITEFAQIVGIGSVLVATATFAAAFTLPGGIRSPSDVIETADHHHGNVVAEPPAGTPVLAGKYAFDGFVISNTLAFICSTLATFSLVYCGVAAVDIQRRFKLVSFSLALLLCAARSFCAAFAFSLYLLLATLEHGTAISACVMTSLALLDGLWFLMASFNDMTVVLGRRSKVALLKVGTGFVANILYLFWPYLVIFAYMFIDDLKHIGRLAHHNY